jgi:PPOX class probable F420-dependent enzyme
MGAAASFARLSTYKYCQLVTFRRSGTAVPTPVWFAVAGHRLYVKTETPSGKVKRIRANAHVEVAPCTVRGRLRGPAVAGHARILDPAEEPAAERALRARYGVGRRLFELVVEPVFRRRGLLPTYVEIVPRGHAA